MLEDSGGVDRAGSSFERRGEADGRGDGEEQGLKEDVSVQPCELVGLDCVLSIGCDEPGFGQT